MNKFYNNICKYYEDIFPLNKNQLEFLNTISQGKDYLDIGCATGLVAKNLENLGKDLICIDLEEKMIEKAKQKNLKAYVKNMMNLDFEKKFDLCYCIGTTISHLENINQVYKFLDQIPNLLKKDGKLVLQWVNFALYTKKNNYFLGSLPTLGKEVKFQRNYYKENDKIRFNTILTTEDGIFENNQLLIPLILDDILDYLKKLNFKTTLYGDFKKSTFNKDLSSFVVLVAEKN